MIQQQHFVVTLSYILSLIKQQNWHQNTAESTSAMRRGGRRGRALNVEGGSNPTSFSKEASRKQSSTIIVVKQYKEQLPQVLLLLCSQL
jgi:hypothetical protein